MNRVLLAGMISIMPVGMMANHDDRFASRVFFPPGLPALYLRQVLEGAMDRLDDPDCRQVFDDFADESGQPLSRNLESLNQAAGQRLGDLLFIDATDETGCVDAQTGAYTTPGSRVIFVCAARFASSSFALTGVAGEILVIHELLHSLGLQEYPSAPRAPTSAQITRRVWARCGRANSAEFRNRRNWLAVPGKETKPSFRVPARPGVLR